MIKNIFRNIGMKPSRLFRDVRGFNFCNKENDNFANFGFKTVKKEDRQTLVNSVFANVAEK
jgi:hypothetical protein